MVCSEGKSGWMEREGWPKERRGRDDWRARAAHDKKNKHRCQLEWSSHPLVSFTAVVLVFHAHLPGMTWMVMRSLWIGKPEGEESDNTDALASHR